MQHPLGEGLARMAELIEWDDRYSVGNSILDEQHKHLVAQCNRLGGCIDRERHADGLFHDILHELAVYAKEHFRTEESILVSRGFPDLEAHKQEHVGYVDRLSVILLAATVGGVGRQEMQGLHRFLTGWFHDHILTSDMRYREFLASA